MANRFKNFFSGLRIFSLLAALLLASCAGLPSQAAPNQANPADGLLNAASTPQLGQVLVTGRVTGVSSGQVSVDNLTFRVDEQTQLPVGLQVGSQARVLAIRLPDNTHYALEISPAPQAAATRAPAGAQPAQPAAPADSGEFQMYGLVQSIEPDAWQVSDMRFRIAPGAEIKGSVQVGDMIKIEGTLQDGAMTAHEIDLVLGNAATAPAPQATQAAGGEAHPGTSQHSVIGGEHELYGVVEFVGAQWIISGTTFLVDDSTQVKGSVAAGSQVKVHYVQLDDGSFMATEIESDDEGESNHNNGGSSSGEDNHDTSESESHSSGDSEGHNSEGEHDFGEGHD